MLLLDISIVTVALPAIQEDLDASFSDLQWVVDAYVLLLASTLLVSGSVADLMGRRRVGWCPPESLKSDETSEFTLRVEPPPVVLPMPLCHVVAPDPGLVGVDPPPHQFAERTRPWLAVFGVVIVRVEGVDCGGLPLRN